ncbi:MAG TPA: glycosyltransferase family 4 protein [Smithellaceae bacterium]|nr:glycosyltransferase family 4 protein [Smithellaceae bacterium]
MQILSTIKSLPLDKYEVSICCYYEYDIEIVQMFKAVCKNVVLMNLEREKGLFYLLQKLFSLFRQMQPDIVHVQYLAPGLIPIIAARLAGMRKVIATVHIAGSYAYGTKAKVLLRIASILCDCFICVSRGVEEFWFGDSQIFDPANINKSRKHYTVYNAIDTAAITQAIKTTDKTKIKRDMKIEGRPVIGIVGRLAEQKGHSILLDAMAQIVKEIPEVILIVIGEGPERQKLIEKTANLQLDKKILWLGAQPQNKVFELYSIMDVFVMPSLYEGFGLTAAEAMAAGMPVVGTRIEGLSEVVEDGVSGVLVPAGNSVALSEAILNLLQDPEKAKMYSKNGRRRADRLFSLENFSKSMQGIYQSI